MSAARNGRPAPHLHPAAPAPLQDHNTIRRVYDKFKEAGTSDEDKQQLAYLLIHEVALHSAKEETVVYPQVGCWLPLAGLLAGAGWPPAAGATTQPDRLLLRLQAGAALCCGRQRRRRRRRRRPPPQIKDVVGEGAARALLRGHQALKETLYELDGLRAGQPGFEQKVHQAMQVRRRVGRAAGWLAGWLAGCLLLAGWLADGWFPSHCPPWPRTAAAHGGLPARPAASPQELSEHISEEEGDLLPRLAQQLPREWLEELGDQFDMATPLAPSRCAWGRCC